MNEITEKEIEKISNEIDQSGLTYVELKNEILDHICCQVEQDMEKGLLFNDAYRKVKQEMGKKRIRQIQHETLSLISKKYRRMKRTLYVTGVIAPALVIAASLFKLMHWPGAAIMIVLGLVLVGLILLPLYVMTRIRDTRKLGEPLPEKLYITGMISSILAIIGALFKIMHWPGASILITIGLVSFAFVFLPMYASTKLKEAKNNNTEANRSLIFGGVVAGILLIMGALFKIMHWPAGGYVLVATWTMVGLVFFPILVLNQLKKSKNQTNTFLSILIVATGSAIFIMALIRSDQRLDVYGYLDLENENSLSANFYQAQAEQILSEANVKFPDSKIPSEVKDLSSKASEIDNFIDQVKVEMIHEIAPKENDIFDASGNIDYRQFDFERHRHFAYYYLAENKEFKLYGMLRNFTDEALLLTSNDLLKSLINNEFDFSLEKEDPYDSWAKHYLLGPFIQSVSMLSMFQSSVRMIEYEILKEHLQQEPAIAVIQNK